MPARVVVSLVPTSAGALPPPETGPGVNAAVLAAVRDGMSPELSAQLHDGPPPRPFSVTPLLDERQQVPARGSRQVRFEVGVLIDDLVGPFLACLAGRDQWRFGSTDYTLGGVELAGAEAYPDLLDAAPPMAAWALRFVTPASFATGKGDGARRQHVLPDPVRVFGTLAARWRTWAPHAPLPAGLDAAITDHLELAEMRLATEEYLVKTGTPKRRGCVGSVRYHLAEPAGLTAEVRSGVEALARFACFAGVGDRTASGMGYTVLEAGRSSPARRPQRTDRGERPRERTPAARPGTNTTSARTTARG